MFQVFRRAITCAGAVVSMLAYHMPHLSGRVCQVGRDTSGTGDDARAPFFLLSLAVFSFMLAVVIRMRAVLVLQVQQRRHAQ